MAVHFLVNFQNTVVLVAQMKLLVVLLTLVVCRAQVPRTWAQSDVDSLELPAPDPANSPVHLDEAAYYRIPERVIYRSYPVYAPGREPTGYREWLESREPEIAFAGSKLNTREDWIRAGQIVFNAPTSFNAVFFSADNLRDAAFFREGGMPVGKDGVVPFARWVVRRKGSVELGSMGCNTCHTRVLRDGTIVPGAQGNNPNDRQGALLLMAAARMMGEEKALARVRTFARQFASPWLTEDFNRRTVSMTLDEFVRAGEQIPAGVTARANTSMILPPQIPDLIGVEERRYLDHTGLIRQRNAGDLMRYSSLAQDLFVADRYGGDAVRSSSLPSARYSDEQLYALALYIYSLRPPANPNLFNAAAARGKAIFRREKCGVCHTPPLFTNNRLVPVEGFQSAETISDRSGKPVGVDPRYTLQTHKATGFYKVPSLKGVWYRGPFGHNGSAATLADWFDPARLKTDYVPTGFQGFDGQTRGIPGHAFGLGLSPAERNALITYLNTL
jgi:hypothetical protein